ncbi:hypothetical protein EAG_11680 [Camponotus floridanus]|uniref:Uncharacterized protein n=1 Tax=Camponotus floridanus TaxID=104421 RepID=E2AFZ7_CAMFO|nr:hypothetical protein EAG_11680 [Camponotus floridanus]
MKTSLISLLIISIIACDAYVSEKKHIFLNGGPPIYSGGHGDFVPNIPYDHGGVALHDHGYGHGDGSLHGAGIGPGIGFGGGHGIYAPSYGIGHGHGPVHVHKTIVNRVVPVPVPVPQPIPVTRKIPVPVPHPVPVEVKRPVPVRVPHPVPVFVTKAYPVNVPLTSIEVGHVNGETGIALESGHSSGLTISGGIVNSGEHSAGFAGLPNSELHLNEPSSEGYSYPVPAKKFF